MTVTELDKRFLFIIDKVGSPYITDTERTSLYNIAQLSVLDDYVYNRKNRAKNSKEAEPSYGHENTSLNVESISNFIVELTEISAGLPIRTDVDGHVTYADIETSINYHTSKATKLYHINNIGRTYSGSFRTCRFVRHNDLYPTIDNSFKTPTEKYPTATYYDDYILLLPVGGAISNPVDVKFSVVRYPTDIVIDETTPANNVDPEWADKVMNEILFRALQVADTGIRDRQHYEMMNLEYNKD